MEKQTIWVFGDQLNRGIGALRDASSDTHQVLIVESASKIKSRRWHIQRSHFFVASMRRFADELRSEGFSVDYRIALSMREGCSSTLLKYSRVRLLLLNQIVMRLAS